MGGQTQISNQHQNKYANIQTCQAMQTKMPTQLAQAFNKRNQMLMSTDVGFNEKQDMLGYQMAADKVTEATNESAVAHEDVAPTIVIYKEIHVHHHHYCSLPEGVEPVNLHETPTPQVDLKANIPAMPETPVAPPQKEERRIAVGSMLIKPSDLFSKFRV